MGLSEVHAHLKQQILDHLRQKPREGRLSPYLLILKRSQYYYNDHFVLPAWTHVCRIRRERNLPAWTLVCRIRLERNLAATHKRKYTSVGRQCVAMASNMTNASWLLTTT